MTKHSEPKRPSMSATTASAGARSRSLPAAAGAAPALVGDRLGKCTTVTRLSVGGVSEVLLGVREQADGPAQVVVIKQVLPHIMTMASFVNVFADEARLATRLEHPNIVRTCEAGEHGGRYYTVMEYLPGESLDTVLNRMTAARRSLPLNVAIEIASQVYNGLHFAHELSDEAGRPLGLVHREINPSNIVLTYSGDVKILDFGAKPSSGTTQASAGAILRKLAYVSPEQVLARGVDRRSDIFSAGAVLWECLTGKTLFARDSDAATLHAIMNDPIPAPSVLRAEVPAGLDALVLRALSRTPSDRYDTAEDMNAALDELLASQPIAAASDVAQTMRELFGGTRAQAKLLLAQMGVLTPETPLVAKLRDDVSSDLAEATRTTRERRLASVFPELAFAAGGARTSARIPVRVVALVVASVAAIGGGLAYVASRGAPDPPAAAPAWTGPATLRLSTAPPGAAVFVNGEPTGLTTPAVLTGLTTKQLAIRIELRGYRSIADVVDLSRGGTVTRLLELVPASGRLVLSKLPAGATILVDGEPHAAGEVITVRAGRHEIRVMGDGRTLAQQVIETNDRDHTWELQGSTLVPK
jgi:serine/threonine protein kinase